MESSPRFLILRNRDERRIKERTLPPIPKKTHCRPNSWAIHPEKLDAEEPKPKAAKKKIPKAVPLISSEVCRAKRVLVIGWEKKFRKKKIKPRSNNRRFVVKDMAKTNGREKRLTSRSRRSR